MSTRVIILGGTGMLGSTVASYLSAQPDLQVTATIRNRTPANKPQFGQSPGHSLLFDADGPDLSDALDVIDGYDWVINAIGVIKQVIQEDNAADVERAIRVNSVFPYSLARRAEAKGAQVIQIATDCVYSGRRGSYVESDEHDALDVYGKTKSLGEVSAPNVRHLRCSIIGPELETRRSLQGWFLAQKSGATVQGFVNHVWNGITTLQFAKICHGLIASGITLPTLQHVVPAGSLNKRELLECFARSFARDDITVVPKEPPIGIDRTLATSNETANRGLWEAAGYQEPPSVPAMIAELAVWCAQTAEPRTEGSRSAF